MIPFHAGVWSKFTRDVYLFNKISRVTNFNGDKYSSYPILHQKERICQDYAEMLTLGHLNSRDFIS